jgi:hypothetical protein
MEWFSRAELLCAHLLHADLLCADLLCADLLCAEPAKARTLLLTTNLLLRNFACNHFVDVAPDPVFAGLDGAHDGMGGLMKMFGGVLVLRRIAAADIAAQHAQAQVNPAISHLYALFADMRSGSFDFDLIQMLAFFRHYSFPPGI